MSTRTEPKTVEVVVGQKYEFVSEVMEEDEAAGKRLRNYTGQEALVLRALGPDEFDADECSPLYEVRFADGREATAHQEELNGWDKALGQFCGPSGVWGDLR